MKKGVLILLSLLIFLVIPSVSASFNYKNNTLINEYTEGEIISGLVNISFQNQSANVNLSSNIGGNITLVKLIENSGYVLGTDFVCSTSNCSEGYNAGEQVTSINVDGKRFIGFRINGKSISRVGGSNSGSIKFNLQSDIAPSCYNQLLVDITGREERYIFNNKTTEVICTSDKEYGCFDPNLGNESYQNSVISTSKYCENITVRAASAYRVGAKVTRRAEGYGNNATLQMSLLDFQGNTLKSCTLGNVSQGSAELECNIIYGSPIQRDFLVCISASTQDSVYQIRREDVGRVCGANTNNLNNLASMDSEVFIRPLQSDSVNISVNNDIFNNFYSTNLGSYMMDYLRANYPENSEGDINCDGGCLIPIGLYGPNQTVSFSNVYLAYYNDGDVNTQSLYSLVKSPGKLSSDFLNIDLSKANFVIPYGSKPSKFILYLNGEKVFEKLINVSAGFDFDISPKKVLIGQDTEIIAGNDSMGINRSIWDFGYDEVVNVNGNKVSKTFNDFGISNIRVTLIKNDGTRASKSFEIEASGTNESTWLLLTQYEKRVNNLTSQIGSYPSWISQELLKKIDVAELNATLYQSRRNLVNAVSDDEIIAVLKNLLSLDVPVGIVKGSAGSFPITVGYNNIDPSYIESLSNNDLNDSSAEDVKAAISKWMNGNYRGLIEFESIDSYDEKGNASSIMTYYKVTLTQNEDSEFNDEKYFIIDYPFDGLTFMQDYDEREKSSGTYIVLKEAQQNFEFILPGFVAVPELGMYISPLVSELDVATEITPAEKPHFNWIRFIIYTSILVFLTLVLYIALQEWYKYRYESYLFRQRNDLYNIITFIFNSRNNKLNDNEIRKRLSGAGWNGEQVTYALKKIDGKRTGMFEIPIMRPFERKKINNEIAKRQIPSSVSFIKGPRL